jgi:hypothetical protein
MQASRLEVRRLEALCESIQHALEERQAEVEKLQAKVRNPPHAVPLDFVHVV